VIEDNICEHMDGDTTTGALTVELRNWEVSYTLEALQVYEKNENSTKPSLY
jgi:hypothetical protein